MTRKELFEYIQKIDDPVKDYSKILSNLHFSHYHLMDKYKKILEKYELTVTQANILGIIVHHHPQPLSLEEIKTMVLEPNSDVSRTIVRLAAKGFVEKIPSVNDKRRLSIRASSQGVKVLKKAASDPKFTSFAKNITLAESKAFIKFLKNLREG